MAGNGVTAAALKEFAAELKTRLPDLQQILDQFPAPNQVIKMPCAVAMIAGDTDFVAHAPYVIRKEEILEDDPDFEEVQPGDVAKKRVIRSVGEYVFSLQLEFWVATKFERHQWFEKFFAAFNQDSIAPGIRLQLSDYYDEFANYTMQGFSMVDGEDQSQRSEWRLKFLLTVDVRGVTESPEYTMETIENTLETPSGVEDIEEEPSEEDDSSVTTII